MIYLLGISSTHIMISLDRHERQSAELLLERIHDIVEHLSVHISVSAISLNEVAYLQCDLSILICKAGASFQQPRTAFTLHFTVAGKFRTLDTIEPFHFFVVM